MADKKDNDEEEKDAAEGADNQVEGDDEGTAKRKKKKKLIIIAAAAVILLGGAGAGVFFSGILSHPAKTETTDKKGKKKKDAKEGGEAPRESTGSSVKAVKQNPNQWVTGVIPDHEGEDSVYYNLPEFLVNLDTNSKQTSFIKMKVTLEAPSDGDSADAIDNRLPRIIDKFNTSLRLLRISDISGSAGLYRLREELLLQVNKEIYPNKVSDILFQEIIVQ